MSASGSSATKTISTLLAYSRCQSGCQVIRSEDFLLNHALVLREPIDGQLELGR
jgi:hypothetical protein